MNSTTSDPLSRFGELLRQTEDRPTLREACREMFAAGIHFDEVARVIWDRVSEKAVADPSWMPAASCVNFADMFSHVELHAPGDQHGVCVYGEPPPEFQRSHPPTAVEGTLGELQVRFSEAAASHDWQLTERCLLGIAQQAGIKSTLATILDHLLQAEFIGTTAGPWWAELRHVTIGCIIEIWQRLGDEAILPVLCYTGARHCAKRTGEADEQKQSAMAAFSAALANLGDRRNESDVLFDEAAFRRQLNTDDVATALGAVSDVWQQGATIEQIGLSMTMHCVERLLRSFHSDGANRTHLKLELMGAASIRKIGLIDEQLAIRTAYHVACRIVRTGNKGLIDQLPEVKATPSPKSNEQIEAIINDVNLGDVSAAIDRTHSFITGKHDGLELLRRLFLAVGYDNTYAGQRCMIEAWHQAVDHPQRNNVLLATVGWEARYRKRSKRPAKNDAQIAAEQNSEPNVFADGFGGSKLSPQWRTHDRIVVGDGTLRFSPVNSSQLVTLRQNFTDFVLRVDVRIVRESAGIVVRWNSPKEYYMVQVGINPSDPQSDKVAWFHVFSPKHCSWHRDDLSGGRKPEECKWYRLRLKVEGFGLTLSLQSLKEDDSIGETLIDELEWHDPDKLFASGAIGFWECAGEGVPGEQAEFRNLRVNPME